MSIKLPASAALRLAKPSRFAWLALGASLSLAAAPALAQPRPLGPKARAKAAADKAAAEKAAADKAAAEKAAADKEAADKAAADKAAADKAATDKEAADKAAADKAAADKAAAEGGGGRVRPLRGSEQDLPLHRPALPRRHRAQVHHQLVRRRRARTSTCPWSGRSSSRRRDHLEYRRRADVRGLLDESLPLQGEERPGHRRTSSSPSSLKLGYLMVDILYEIPLPFERRRRARTAASRSSSAAASGSPASSARSTARQAYPNRHDADPGNPSQWSACTARPTATPPPAPATAGTRPTTTTGPAGLEEPQRRRRRRLQRGELGQRRLQADRSSPGSRSRRSASATSPSSSSRRAPTSASRPPASSSASRRATGCDRDASRRPAGGVEPARRGYETRSRRRRSARAAGGEVWAVRDRITGRTVALKALAEGAHEREVQALVREAVALSGVEGLGVPRVLRFGRLPGASGAALVHGARARRGAEPRRS